jgi:hypothetical protein
MTIDLATVHVECGKPELAGCILCGHIDERVWLGELELLVVVGRGGGDLNKRQIIENIMYNKQNHRESQTDGIPGRSHDWIS